jgi:hypothetical protein
VRYAVDREDRPVVVVLALLMIVGIGLAVWIVRSDPGSDQTPSSYGTGNSGAKAAYLLLRDTGYDVTRSAENPRTLAQRGRGTTLILVEPIPGTEEDLLAVRSFVERGGRLVGTGVAIALFFPGDHTLPKMPHFDWQSYPAYEPSDLTRGISSIDMAPQFYFRGTGGDEVPFKKDREIPVTRFHYGSGEVIWWASAQPLTNAGIGRADNAQLLLNSVGDPLNRTVLWDEYFHGEAKTLFQSIFGSPLKWGLVQLCLLAGALCFTFSRRFGAPRGAPLPSRLATKEFVDTLAELYRNAKAGNVAVEVVYQRFRLRLQQRYSVRRDADSGVVARAVAPFVADAERGKIHELLTASEAAVSDHDLDPRRASLLVQQLHTLSESLGLISEEPNGSDPQRHSSRARTRAASGARTR